MLASVSNFAGCLATQVAQRGQEATKGTGAAGQWGSRAVKLSKPRPLLAAIPVETLQKAVHVGFLRVLKFRMKPKAT